MAKSEKNTKMRSSFVKDLAAPTIQDAISKMDEWGQSIYDMFVVKYEDYEERPGYIRITVFGWENNKSRVDYDC